MYNSQRSTNCFSVPLRIYQGNTISTWHKDTYWGSFPHDCKYTDEDIHIKTLVAEGSIYSKCSSPLMTDVGLKPSHSLQLLTTK